MEAILIGIGMNAAAVCGAAKVPIGLGMIAVHAHGGALNLFQNLGIAEFLTTLGSNIASLAAGLL